MEMTMVVTGSLPQWIQTVMLRRLLLAVLLWVALAGAATGGVARAETISLLFPSLKSLPAPAWVQEGTRLTYRGMTATVGGTADQAGIAGENLIQVDVVALESPLAILQTRLWLKSDAGYQPYPATGEVGLASCAGEWWVNPKALGGKLPGGVASNPSFTKMPYVVGGKTYSALRVQYATKTGNTVWVFDLELGLLLHMLSSEATADGRRQQSDMTLVNRRRLTLPWLALKPNVLVATLGGYVGQGTYTVSVAGGPPTSMGLTVQAQTTDRGKRWLAYRQQSVVQTSATPASPDVTFAVVGPGQIGGLLLPLNAGAGLAQGKALDVDEVTGARFYVASATAQGVVLCEELPNISTYWSYDRRGYCTRLVSATRGFAAIGVDVILKDK